MNFKNWILNEVKYSEFKGLDATEIQRFLRKSVVRTPVYHGTDTKFDQFEKRPSQRFVLFSAFDVQAQGFFFAEKKKDALEYGRNIITAYVRLENPLLDPRRTEWLGSDKLPAKKEAELAYILRGMIGKENDYRYMDIGVRRNYISDSFAKDKDYSWIYEAIDSGGLEWDVLDNPKVAAAMKRLGYDGTFVHEKNQPLKDRSVFVLDASQIKIVGVERT